MSGIQRSITPELAAHTIHRERALIGGIDSASTTLRNPHRRAVEADGSVLNASQFLRMSDNGRAVYGTILRRSAAFAAAHR